MAPERTQYSTVLCTFLWEDFPGLKGIFTKFFLRFEDLYNLCGPFDSDKVDEVNMFP
jgi:hypothetical protein